MAYQAAVPPSPNPSYRSERDQRNAPRSNQESFREIPYAPSAGGSVSGSFRDVRAQGPYHGSSRNVQDPNVSFGSQRRQDLNMSVGSQHKGDPGMYQGSQRSVHDPNMSMSSNRILPTDRSTEWRQGSVRGDQDYVKLHPQQDSRQGSLRNRHSYASDKEQSRPLDHPSTQQQQMDYYQQQQRNDYQQQQPLDYNAGSRSGSMRNVSTSAHQRQMQPGYPSSGQNQHHQVSPHYGASDQGYKQMGSSQRGDPRRTNSQNPRDYPDATMGSRQGSIRSVQGGGFQDTRPGSSRGQGQGSGARNRRSTGSSIYGLLDEGRGLNGMEIAGYLQVGFVLLTGGRDTQGGPILTLPSMQNRNDPGPDELTTCLQYLIQIPSEETKRKGFSTIVDTRAGSWANLNLVVGCLRQTIGGYLKQVLVVHHENDKRANQDRPSNAEPRFVTVNQLPRYIDPKQLTADLGGQMVYDHDSWLRNQLNYERFLKDAQATVDHLDSQEGEIQKSYGPSGQSDPQASPLEALRKHRHFQEAIMTVPTEVIRQGQELLSSLQDNGYSGYIDSQGMVPTLDNLEAQKQVKRVLQYLTNRVDKMQDFLEDRDRSLNSNMRYEEWKRNIKTVVDWVLGPGEKLLASQKDIGDSYEAAEELRRRHEEMEIKCTDTYGQYAELRHTAEEIIEEGLSAVDDLKAERDYMDTVCRSFASRLERRRTLLITSVRFHRFAEDFSHRLDELLELLCSDIQADTVEAVEKALKTLQDKLDACDHVAEQSLNDGQSLLDEMSRPVKNAFGKDISPDYASQIKHINKKLEELQERKMRCNELADVRKLKLQQLLQLRTCERDTDQAIDWINELCDVMVCTHTDMGKSSEEAESLHDDHKKFEATALGTYEYGKQLLQAALVLRRSLRYDVEPSHERARRLEEAWKRFSKGTSERANRLTVSAMFLNESDKLLNTMEDFISACAKALAGEASIDDAVRNLALPKTQIGKDFDNTTQMGQALVDRLSLPIILVEGDEKRLSIDDDGASETVSNRLRKLDRKMSDTDRYWDELHKAQADPNFQPKAGHIFERTPSERRKDRSPGKAKTRPSAEAEERKRRSDPFGIASKRKAKPVQEGGHPVPAPRRRVPSHDETDRMNQSYSGIPHQTSPRSSQQNGSQYPSPSDRRNLNRSYDSSPGDLRGSGYNGDHLRFRPSSSDPRNKPETGGYHGRQASMPDLSNRSREYAQEPALVQTAQTRQASMPDLNQREQEQLQGHPSSDHSYESIQSSQQQQSGTFDDSVHMEEVAPRLGSAPIEMSDPLYSNQPVQPRPQKSLLDLDWLGPMHDPNASLENQLEQS